MIPKKRAVKSGIKWNKNRHLDRRKQPQTAMDRKHSPVLKAQKGRGLVKETGIPKEVKKAYQR